MPLSQRVLTLTFIVPSKCRSVEVRYSTKGVRGGTVITYRSIHNNKWCARGWLKEVNRNQLLLRGGSSGVHCPQPSSAVQYQGAQLHDHLLSSFFPIFNSILAVQKYPRGHLGPEVLRSFFRCHLECDPFFSASAFTMHHASHHDPLP